MRTTLKRRTVAARGGRQFALVGLLLVGTLAGCAWRVDSPDPSPLIPSPDELARNAAALAESRIVEALDDGRADSQSAQWLLTFERTAAGAHLDALGGVYTPADLPTPSSSAPPVDVGPTAYARLAPFARDTELASALTVDDASLALLLASAGLSHAVALAVASEDAARAAGQDVPMVAERTAPIGAQTDSGSIVPAETSVSPEALEALIVAHDHAEYVYDVIAARSEGTERDDALARAWIHHTRADALVALAGTDPRGPSYALNRDGLGEAATRGELVADLESTVAAQYLDAFAGVVSDESIDSLSERTWLLTGAFDALMASVDWVGGPRLLDAFPGVSVQAT